MSETPGSSRREAPPPSHSLCRDPVLPLSPSLWNAASRVEDGHETKRSPRGATETAARQLSRHVGELPILARNPRDERLNRALPICGVTTPDLNYAYCNCTSGPFRPRAEHLRRGELRSQSRPRCPSPGGSGLLRFPWRRLADSDGGGSSRPLPRRRPRKPQCHPAQDRPVIEEFPGSEVVMEATAGPSSPTRRQS